MRVFHSAPLLLSLLPSCSATDPVPGCPPPPPPQGGPPFVDATESLGISADHHFASDFCDLTDTTGGPGVCLLDFDADRDLDIYFVDRAPFPNMLYRNDGDRFLEVAAEVGAASTADSMGCLAFDRDGDGDLDLYLTNTGPDQLLDNRGGTFVDISVESGIAAQTDGFGVTAVAGDVDADGDLDVFVGQSVDLSTCPAGCSISPIACAPRPSLLLDNRGPTFVEVAAERGITDIAPTLAALFWDFDGDTDLDLYVGNDMGIAFDDRLYVNDGQGRFSDQGARFGLEGPGTDTMGADVGDFDLDGRTDLVISDFKDRPIRIYRCFDPSLPCSSETAPDSTEHVKWAVGLVDFDHDVDLDLMVTSGDVAYRDGDRSYLYFNQGDGALAKHEPAADDPWGAPLLARGAAFGDLNGDGAVDAVVAVAGGRHRVLVNRAMAGHSLLVSLDTLAAGATVRVDSEAGSITEHALSGNGYAGSSDPRLHFGLGAACRADVTVTYVGGQQVTALGREAGGVVEVVR